MERIIDYFGFNQDEDEDNYYDLDEDSIKEEKTTTERLSRPSTRKEPVSLHSSSTTAQMKITVHEPLTYDESPNIVHDLRERKAVVLNFEQLDPDIKRNIFDFVNGALYALDGKIQRVNNDIFILAPSNIAIEGLKEELQEKGVFPW